MGNDERLSAAMGPNEWTVQDIEEAHNGYMGKQYLLEHDLQDRVKELWCKGANDDYAEEGQVYQFIETWEDLAGIEVSLMKHTGRHTGFVEHNAGNFDGDTKLEVYSAALLWLDSQQETPHG